MEGTLWAFLPAVIAIVLALVTKQVYVSLFLGIFVGAMMFTGGDPLNALFTLFKVMSEKVGANVPIIVFLVVLGILVVLMQKSGGARAYGDWAGKKIKTKGGALAATAVFQARFTAHVDTNGDGTADIIIVDTIRERSVAGVSESIIKTRGAQVNSGAFADAY